MTYDLDHRIEPVLGRRQFDSFEANEPSCEYYLTLQRKILLHLGIGCGTVARLLLIPEDPGSNPVIRNFN